MKDLFTASPHLSPEKIRDYLAAQLDDQERFEVENHLLDCELCNAAVEGFSEFPAELEAPKIEALAKRFPPQEMAKEAQLSPLRRSYTWRNRLAIAAAVLLLPLAAWWYWQAQNSDPFFSQFYQSYQSDFLAVRSPENPADPLLKEGILQYQNQNYSASLPLLESYLEEEPEQSVAAFHAGMASIELGETRQAIAYLERVRLNDPQYYEDATWYLILAHLKLQEKEEAQALLDDLLKIDQGFYEAKAQQIKTTLLEEAQ